MIDATLFFMTERYNTQSGNIFFYIFIAIALFGALTYALSTGTRTGASSLTREQASNAANEILAYTGLIEQAVQKLRLRGCTDTQIDVSHALDFGNEYDNATAPSDNSCDIFHTNGGNVTFVFPEADWLVPLPSATKKAYKEYYFSGDTCVDCIGDSGCVTPELVMIVSYLKKEICDAINQKLNITAELNDTSAFTMKNSDRFGGTYNLETEIDNDTDITGRMSGCVYNTSIDTANTPPAPGYTYYTVLWARG